MAARWAVVGAAVAASVESVAGVSIASFEDGMPFDKCIASEDWNTRTALDDIELLSKEANGCCPKGSVPGHDLALTTDWGPQVVCGITAFGNIETGFRDCDYGGCFVRLYDLLCQDGKQVRLNGCCSEGRACEPYGKCGYQEGRCRHQAITTASGDELAGDVSAEWCSTWHPLAGEVGENNRRGTEDKSDDMRDGRLQADNVWSAYNCLDDCVNCSSGHNEDVISGAAMISGASPRRALHATVVAGVVGLPAAAAALFSISTAA